MGGGGSCPLKQQLICSYATWRMLRSIGYATLSCHWLLQNAYVDERGGGENSKWGGRKWEGNSGWVYSLWKSRFRKESQTDWWNLSLMLYPHRELWSLECMIVKINFVNVAERMTYIRLMPNSIFKDVNFLKKELHLLPKHPTTPRCIAFQKKGVPQLKQVSQPHPWHAIPLLPPSCFFPSGCYRGDKPNRRRS